MSIRNPYEIPMTSLLVDQTPGRLTTAAGAAWPPWRDKKNDGRPATSRAAQSLKPWMTLQEGAQ